MFRAISAPYLVKLAYGGWCAAREQEGLVELPASVAAVVAGGSSNSDSHPPSLHHPGSILRQGYHGCAESEVLRPNEICHIFNSL
jgi:hypothetical protein